MGYLTDLRAGSGTAFTLKKPKEYIAAPVVAPVIIGGLKFIARLVIE